MKYYAIIVGGGSGKRMQNNIPKQFMLLKGKPVLMHTITIFALNHFQPEIIVVLHSDLHQYWKDLCLKFDFIIPHVLICGGEQRFHSVRNGLLAINEDGIVAIHDAVRPLATSDLITKAYDGAAINGNAVAAIKPSDSVRKVNALKESSVINRDELMLIQTPQTFVLEQLRSAYQQPFDLQFTDDASVVEKIGYSINLIEGERNNIKITYPEDLELANLLIK